MTSPEQREQRRLAGRRSGQARRMRGNPLPAPDAGGPVPVTGSADLDSIMAEYVAMVGKPQSWPDVKTYEQVRGEVISNRTRADEDAIRRRQLYTHEQIAERDRAYDALWMEVLNSLPEFIAADAEPSAKHAARDKAKAWIADARKRVAESMKGRA